MSAHCKTVREVKDLIKKALVKAEYYDELDFYPVVFSCQKRGLAKMVMQNENKIVDWIFSTISPTERISGKNIKKWLENNAFDEYLPRILFNDIPGKNEDWYDIVDVIAYPYDENLVLAIKVARTNHEMIRKGISLDRYAHW